MRRGSAAGPADAAALGPAACGRCLDLVPVRRIIPLMKFVHRTLNRALVALIASALIAPLASGSTEPVSESGETVCCGGIAADTVSWQCGTGGDPLSTGGSCTVVCAGAFVVCPLVTRASLRHAVPHPGTARLTGHADSPDPYPPKIPAVS